MTVSATSESGGLAPDEAALFRQAQAGCRKCLDRLLVAHEGLIHAVVQRQTTLGPLSYAEAVQAGRLGLWNAILRFDLKRGQAFSTFAWPCIMHRVWNEVKMAQRSETRAHHPDTYQRLALPRPGDEDWLNLRHDILVRFALRRLFARLPQRFIRVLQAYYGLDGSLPASFQQIGEAIGLTREGVRRQYIGALVWLRHPAHSQELRALLGRHSLADYQTADDQAQSWLLRRGNRHGRPL